ncbi:unnamed protein product, partial [Cuscuta epithymum]
MNETESFVEFFLARVAEFSEEKLKLFGMTMWSIWRRRNVLYWDGIRETNTQVISRGAEILQTWNAAQQPGRNVKDRSMNLARWKRPPIDFVKCNVDAAIFYNAKCVGFGCCIRNHVGRFYQARTAWINAEMSPREAEAWGLREAIKWVKQKDYTKVVFESDCKQLIDDLYGKRVDQSEYASLVQDCRDLLVSNNDFCVVFTRRQANSSAHVLARASTNFASCMDFTCTPDCISNIIINE